MVDYLQPIESNLYSLSYGIELLQDEIVSTLIHYGYPSIFILDCSMFCVYNVMIDQQSPLFFTGLTVFLESSFSESRLFQYQRRHMKGLSLKLLCFVSVVMFSLVFYFFYECSFNPPESYQSKEFWLPTGLQLILPVWLLMQSMIKFCRSSRSKPILDLNSALILTDLWSCEPCYQIFHGWFQY